MIYVVKKAGCQKQININFVFNFQRFNNFLGKVSDSLKMFKAMLRVGNTPHFLIYKIFYFEKLRFRHFN